MRIRAIIDDLLQDLRYSLRTLRHDAGFTTFAILIVGLGIGASVTVFSISDAVLIRPLPFRAPERLVWIGNGDRRGLSAQTTQVGHLVDLTARDQSFSDLAGYFAFYGVGDNNLTGTGEPERLSAVPVTQNFFPVLGIQPIIGRGFTAEESSGSGPSVALLSHGLWARRFFTLMLGGFAVFALSLALLGIYSVISYTVTQRTQEIAVRMALGASAAQLQARIIRETLGVAAAGMVAGSAASWILARTLGGFLYGVTAADPVTFVAMLAILTLAATLGGYLPARRASRIDPMEAIRSS
jgi:hypothetical protein